MTVTHPELVRVLVKPPENIIEMLSPHFVDLWHGATGVAGEGGELLEGIMLVLSSGSLSGDSVAVGRENVLEESGDLYFYIEQLVQRTKIELDWDAITSFAVKHHIGPDMMLDYAARVAVFSSQVLDTVKKGAIYNKELDVKLLTRQLTALCSYLMTIGYMFGVSHEDALEANIAKLSKRYEGLRYTDKAAQLRADKPPERKFFGQDPPVGAPVVAPISPPPSNPDE